MTSAPRPDRTEGSSFDSLIFANLDGTVLGMHTTDLWGRVGKNKQTHQVWYTYILSKINYLEFDSGNIP